jgi:glycosyltransferase involved in cell wall biosynthesis
MNTSEPGLSLRNPVVERHTGNAELGDDTTTRPGIFRNKILFVVNSLDGGGAERIFSIVVNHVRAHLNASDIEVLLLDNNPPRYEIDPTINVECLNSNGSLWDSAWRFRRFIAARRPQLVVSFLPRSNYLAVAFAPIYGYRCIISERSDTTGRIGGGFSGRLERQLVRLLYPRAHGLICVAEALRRSLVHDYSVAPQTACTIHNPVDFDKINKLAQQPCPLQQEQLKHGFILAVGRLNHVKRFDVLIRAYAQANPEQPLVILGEGPKLEELQNLALALGVAERVIFAGFLPNPYAVMAHASLFVMSSEREGFPNALVEAMAVGLPVIATNCHHGPAEILDDTATLDISDMHQGRYGLLVPTNNVAAMASTMQQVLTSSELRASLAERAGQRARHFTAPAAILRYATVINEQLALIGQIGR